MKLVLRVAITLCVLGAAGWYLRAERKARATELAHKKAVAACVTRFGATTEGAEETCENNPDAVPVIGE
jgi:hypothetical protein